VDQSAAIPEKARAIRFYLDAVVRFRWLIIIATLVAVAAASYGARFLTFDPDTRLFLAENNPDRIALDHLERTYGKISSLIIVVAPEAGDVFTRASLKIIGDLTEKAWQLPHTLSVHSLTNYQHSYARGDEILVEDLVGDFDALDDVRLVEIRQTALGSEELAQKLVSTEGDVSAIVVESVQPDGDMQAVPEIATAARALAEDARRLHPSVDIRLSGSVMADMTFAEAGQRELGGLAPIMFGLILGTLTIGLRSLWASLATMFVIGMSVATALGIAGWAGLVLNGATAAAPIMIMGLGLADSVHVATTVRQRLKVGATKNDAVKQAMRLNAGPIALTSLTTVMGFLTLNFAESPPLKELGNIVAVGVIAAFVYSVGFLPALLSILPAPGTDSWFQGAKGWQWLGNTLVARRGTVVIGFAVVSALTIAGVHRIAFDDDFIKYFDHSYEFRRDTDFMQSRLLGMHVLEYSIPSGEEQGITRADYLHTLDSFADWFRKQEKVFAVDVLSSKIKRLNKNMHGDDEAFERIPEDRRLSAQLLLFYEMSLPIGHDLNQEIDVGKSSSLMVVHLKDVSSAQIRELGERGEEWLRQNAPDMVAPATGLSIAYASLSERNVRSMLFGTLFGLVMISIVLLVVLRSIPVGLISFAPNLLPASMALGIWGYINGEVNLAVSVVGAMTFGIIVDDTIHFLSKYLRARRELGFDTAEAVRYTLATVGDACVLTTIALVLGFGVLATSGFAVSAQMGLLSAITISLALAADLLLLPALLLLLARNSS
jgi:uncharacterized protein